jgi:hypothetical protein
MKAPPWGRKAAAEGGEVRRVRDRQNRQHHALEATPEGGEADESAIGRIATTTRSKRLPKTATSAAVTSENLGNDVWIVAERPQPQAPSTSRRCPYAAGHRPAVVAAPRRALPEPRAPGDPS